MLPTSLVDGTDEEGRTEISRGRRGRHGFLPIVNSLRVEVVANTALLIN
jgi:hypothetical protein